jgi:amino acid permease
MYYWVQDESPFLWLGVFLILPILLNLLNVQRIGEIEFVLTAIKIFTLLGIVIFGLVLAGSGTKRMPLLGTDATYHAVPCSENVIGQCLSGPGFKCMLSD